VHPLLEGAEDDRRKNLVAEVNAERGELGALRAAFIAESRKVGRLAVRDIEVLDGSAAAIARRDRADEGNAARSDPRFRSGDDDAPAGHRTSSRRPS
jgi:hypothetical protein